MLFIVGLFAMGAPAWLSSWHVTRSPIPESFFKVRGRSGGRSSAWLVVIEVGIAVALLAGAGLLSKSLWLLEATDLGFEVNKVSTVQLNVPNRGVPREKTARLFLDLEEDLQAHPEVEAAGAARTLPLVPIRSGLRDGSGGPALEIEGGTRPSVRANLQSVTAGYFQAMGIDSLEGRTFNRRDLPSTPRVVVVNRAMARLAWGANSPLGRTLRSTRIVRNPITGEESTEPPATVVGVVANVRSSLTSLPEAIVYYPHSQHGTSGDMQVVVRTASSNLDVELAVRRALQDLRPGAPTAEAISLHQLRSSELAIPRLAAFVASALAGLALFVSPHGRGRYDSLLRRRQRMGVRDSFGSRRPEIFSCWLSLVAVGRAAVRRARRRSPSYVGACAVPQMGPRRPNPKGAAVCAPWARSRLLQRMARYDSVTGPHHEAQIAALSST